MLEMGRCKKVPYVVQHNTERPCLRWSYIVKLSYMSEKRVAVNGQNYKIDGHVTLKYVLFASRCRACSGCLHSLC